VITSCGLTSDENGTKRASGFSARACPVARRRQDGARAIPDAGHSLPQPS
jgi:hypothetical protein